MWVRPQLGFPLPLACSCLCKPEFLAMLRLLLASSFAQGLPAPQHVAHLHIPWRIYINSFF